MSIASRKALYAKIEKMRKRPLIVYVTSQRRNSSGTMGYDVVPEFCDQVNALPKTATSVDVMIVSTGGDPMVAWRAISMLRERVNKISVLIPSCAYSAATLLTLGADEIVMHTCGNLGPVDPQISGQHKNPDGSTSHFHFGTEDLTAFLDFAKKRVGITDQACLLESFKMFATDVGATAIGIAARSGSLSQKLGIKMLQTHLHGSDSKESQSIVDKLNKEFFNHGYPVSKTEAKEIGLPVAKGDAKLEQAIWDVWLEIEKDLKMRVPFNPMEVFSDVVVHSAPGNVNANCTAIHAILESTRIQRMCTSEHVISGVKNADGSTTANASKKGGWWGPSVDEAS